MAHLRQLTDADLETAVKRLAACARRLTADLIEHLVEFDARQLYLGAGFRSLFLYCREVLLLSEGEAYNRIEACRAARGFPLLLDRLRDGGLNLTTVRLIAPHLTGANQQALIAECCGKSKSEVGEIVARIAPREDVPASVRKMPVDRSEVPAAAARERRLGPMPSAADTPEPQPPEPLTHRPVAPAQPLTAALSPNRYQVRFTASKATCEKLRLAQDLLRHAIPDGDPAQVIDRALTLLLDDIARKKAAVTPNPQPRRAGAKGGATLRRRTRNIPAHVRRAVWLRDGGRCTFVGKTGRCCGERAFLEFHHVDPEGIGGEASEWNIELRCRAHNRHEAVLFYGPGVLQRPPGKRKEKDVLAHVP